MNVPPTGGIIGGMRQKVPQPSTNVPPAGQLSGVDLAAIPASSRVVRLHDGDGLYLEIHPRGSRYWRIRYRHLGRENSLSLGVFPKVDLHQARAAAVEVRSLIAQGIDPSATRKAARIAEMAAEASLREPGNFLLSQVGALVVQLPGRAFTLSPSETRELRVFLAHTADVGQDHHAK